MISTTTTRTARFGAYVGDGFEVDASGLITSENVYHDADSLAASGLLAGS